ncbi:hypothetical protein L506_4590 [Bordetella bronchiseptica GA96-01]|nr:hypothetical protein L572_4601 [Bordetella bronchiseptica 345]KCV50982.1 hypothetical protein L492_4501 [Bordetella bronchiseptica 7E71]KDC41084.1 hypothetical protein L506_4590 [Bordetella bronchiseptica GA96-01]
MPVPAGTGTHSSGSARRFAYLATVGCCLRRPAPIPWRGWRGLAPVPVPHEDCRLPVRVPVPAGTGTLPYAIDA